MSNTNARAAFPSVFAFSTESNAAWWATSTNTSANMSTKYVTCAGITKIMPPKYTRAFVDITDMNSTDYYEDNALAGPVRTGTVGFEANYLSTNTQQKTDFETAFSAGTPIGWMITIAGA